MNPLLIGFAAALFFLLRKKKPTTPPPGQPGPGTKTPQGQLVILTNAVLANKLPCIDPAGKQRVFVLKEIEKQSDDNKLPLLQIESTINKNQNYIPQPTLFLNPAAHGAPRPPHANPAARGAPRPPPS